MANTQSSLHTPSKRPPEQSKKWLYLFFAGIFLFALISFAVSTGALQKIDLQLLEFISAKLTHPSLTAFMEKFTHLGSAFGLRIVYALMVLFCLIVKKYRYALAIFITGGGGFLLSDLLKLIFHRERPLGSLIGPVEQFSYPSGHAIASVVFYGLIGYMVTRSGISKANKMLISIFVSLIALVIGFSRIYLKAHYASDVMAGFCVGAAWLMLMIFLFEKFELSNRKNNQPHSFQP